MKLYLSGYNLEYTITTAAQEILLCNVKRDPDLYAGNFDWIFVFIFKLRL